MSLWQELKVQSNFEYIEYDPKKSTNTATRNWVTFRCAILIIYQFNKHNEIHNERFMQHI